MQGWTATTRYRVTRKRSTKRLKHIGNPFTFCMSFFFFNDRFLFITYTNFFPGLIWTPHFLFTQPIVLPLLYSQPLLYYLLRVPLTFIIVPPTVAPFNSVDKKKKCIFLLKRKPYWQIYDLFKLIILFDYHGFTPSQK